MKNLLVVCGPTASGKTRLGVGLALAFGGEIISVDSRQVYRGMDIGTGKDLAEYSTHHGTVPYHLIDIADPRDIYTLPQYQRDFYGTVERIRARGKLPVAVGGTGLYLEAVLKRYRVPSVPEDPGLRRELALRDKEWLDSHLARLNRAIYDRTDRSSKKRLIRAIEVATGRADDADCLPANTPEINPAVLCVTWERSALRQRIDKRLDERLRGGMIDEVKHLLESGIDRERFALFGMEYKHIARYLAGQVDYDTMVTELRHAIHQLAKRQETWFRGMERRGIEVAWVPEADLEKALQILEGYGSFAVGH